MEFVEDWNASEDRDGGVSVSGLVAPFPWFGGKASVAGEVWARFGNVANYVEAFGGSLAVLLARPTPPQTETVNDLDGMLVNFFRAVRGEPEKVAWYADYPQTQADVTARHIWLVTGRESLTARLMGDPEWYDAKAAGWWVYGISCWIGGGWCSGRGPWTSEDGLLVKKSNGGGVAGNKSLHLWHGQGVHRQSLDSGGLYNLMRRLSERLRYVRINCSDWTSLTSPCVTYRHGLTGYFADPPYASTRDMRYFVDSTEAAWAVREWAIREGENPLMRIAVCHYEEDGYTFPPEWESFVWKAHGGYSNLGDGDTLGKANAHKERIWFSPHCLKPGQGRLF